MAIMEKKAFFGPKKKGRPNKRNKKNYLLNKVLDHLKSDSYLFAPLTSVSSSSSRPDFRSLEVEIKERVKEKNKKLVKKVGGYLMSDSYMYAPLVVPSKSLRLPTKGPKQQTKHVTVEVARRSISLKGNTGLENEIVPDKASKDHLSRKLIPDRQCFVHKATVKQAIYRNCRSLSGR